ncbi:MAG: acetoacetate decarboxylase family protein [Micromonosporaceae bacterium]
MAAHLKGFTNPLSPTGNASTVEPPPHHISADAIRVVFRAGEDVAARYLPDGLEPVDGGLGFAYVADMMKVSASEPDQAYLSPQRTQYGEGIIGFYCQYQGVRGRFSAFIWVDQDWSMQFGTVMGWPKKIGNIHRTRINPYNPAMQPLGPGSRLKGLVHRYGRLVFEIGVEIEQAEEPAGNTGQHGQRAYLLRHLPAVGPKIQEVRQLVALPLANVRTGDVFSGKPHLAIGDAENEDLEPLRNVELVRGYTYKSGWTTDTVLELLRDYNE